MNSTELINTAKDAFNKLMHKDYDYRSFYNGFLDGYTARINEEKEERKDYLYCPYCWRMLNPEIKCNADSKLICAEPWCGKLK